MKTTHLILIPACVIAVGVGVGLYWWPFQKDESAVSSTETTTITEGQQPHSLGAESSLVPIEAVSMAARTVTSQDSVGIKARRTAVQNLSRNLEGDDLIALMDFISRDRPEDCGLSQWHALVDGIMNTLRRQNKAPKGLSQTLVNLYTDSQDVVLQDYAIQHLRSWYVDRGSFDKHEANPILQDLVLKTLLHAASQNQQTYSGTALMALHAIDTASELKNDPVVQKQIQSQLRDLDALIFNAAKDSKTNKHCRISALQVCALRGMKDILPTARELAADKTANTNIRISAIAAIGQLGNTEQDTELLQLLEGQSRRLAYAAKPARAKLSSQADR